MKWHNAKAVLWTHGQDAWTLDDWALEFWSTGRLHSRWLDSEPLDEMFRPIIIC